MVMGQGLDVLLVFVGLPLLIWIIIKLSERSEKKIDELHIEHDTSTVAPSNS
jgi:hypothetical protein